MALRFRDYSGETRLYGDLVTEGGSTGDVLTQQADGTFAPATGGGSQPVTVTYSAAEVAARFDVGDGAAFMAWDAITEDNVVVAVFATDNTLDNSNALDQLYAFTPGATSDDVYNGGEVLAQGVGASAGTYRDSFTLAAIVTGKLTAGNVAYVGITGSGGAPTTGSITLAAWIA